MGMVITFANEKGGVGKTTSAACFAWVLANYHKKKVLAIDFDAQGNLSDMLCEEEKERGKSLYEQIGENLFSPISRFGLDIIPGKEDLVAFPDLTRNLETGNKTLLPWLATHAYTYDFILIDTLPHFGEITINAYAASDLVIAVTEPQYFSFKAIEIMVKNVELSRETLENEDLALRVLINRYDPNSRIHAETRNALEELYGSIIFRNFIKKRSSVEKLQMFFGDDKIRQEGLVQYYFPVQELLDWAEERNFL